MHPGNAFTHCYILIISDKQWLHLAIFLSRAWWLTRAVNTSSTYYEMMCNILASTVAVCSWWSTRPCCSCYRCTRFFSCHWTVPLWSLLSMHGLVSPDGWNYVTSLSDHACRHSRSIGPICQPLWHRWKALHSPFPSAVQTSSSFWIASQTQKSLA